MFVKGLGMAVVQTRRERLRAATLAEIKEAARGALVREGPTAISLRAIAREMGMTAPALYRYFGSREDLVDALVEDLFTELSAEVAAARDAEAPDDLAGRLVGASRAFRSWAVAHPAEFGLIFGSPVLEPAPLPEDEDSAGRQFAEIFLALFVELWTRRPFLVPEPTELDPVLLRQVEAFAERAGGGLPAGAVLAFLTCWARLYGLVAMEVFGHLRFCLDDAQPMFERTLRELGEMLGLGDEYRPLT